MSNLTFIAAVNNEGVLHNNLLASPCLKGAHSHQVILIRDAKSAAEAYNAGLEQAVNDIVVFLHQDVLLPEGWPELFQQRWAEAEAKFGPIDVAGTYGVAADGTRCGRLRYRGAPLYEPTELPAKVRTFDELLVAMPRSTKLRFDPSLGFHFYGCDIAMQATTAVVLEAELHHNSYNLHIPPAFYKSQEVFARKWHTLGATFPIQTSCTAVQ
jgi:hypothetical protein